jgi:hypothetical protein
MRALTFWLMLVAPLLADAHGLLLDADTDGRTISGRLYYSNGELAINESIALLDLTARGAKPEYTRTDQDAKFVFPVEASHRYRVSAYGEEGHTVEIELTAEASAKAELVDNDAAADEPSWLPPAWALIGGLLLVSLAPAALRKQRMPG